MVARLLARCAVRLCAPLIASGIALAQDLVPAAREVPLPEDFISTSGDAIPQWEGIWAVVFVHTTVVNDGSPGSGALLLKHQFGLDDGTATTLFQHVQASLEARRHAASVAREGLCEARDRIVSREDFVREMAKIRTASDDVRAEAVAQVEGIVGTDAYTKILEASDRARSSMGSVDVDYQKRLSNEPLSAVAEHSDRICGGVMAEPLPTL